MRWDTVLVSAHAPREKLPYRAYSLLIIAPQRGIMRTAILVAWRSRRGAAKLTAIYRNTTGVQHNTLTSLRMPVTWTLATLGAMALPFFIGSSAIFRH